MAELLSAWEKADLADALKFNLALKRSEAKSCPSHARWDVRSSSDVIDAGNLDAFPRTACSGLKPSLTERVFFA